MVLVYIPPDGPLAVVPRFPNIHGRDTSLMFRR
jgi:hypothetical protein